MNSTTTREYDKVTAVRLNQQDYGKLVRIADTLGITRSDVIRILLREYERIELVVTKV
jgi:antitoxin component of RelBE/YafQ-DinJ toxin-antitoxin module